MATITLQMTNECNGRCHGDIRVSLDGVLQRVITQMDTASLLGPVSDDDIEGFVRILVRIAARTRTPAQIRTGLLNTFTVTV